MAKEEFCNKYLNDEEMEVPGKENNFFITVVQACRAQDNKWYIPKRHCAACDTDHTYIDDCDKDKTNEWIALKGWVMEKDAGGGFDVAKAEEVEEKGFAAIDKEIRRPPGLMFEYIINNHNPKNISEFKTHPEDWVELTEAIKKGGEIMYLSLCTEGDEVYLRPAFTTGRKPEPKHAQYCEKHGWNSPLYPCHYCAKEAEKKKAIEELFGEAMGAQFMKDVHQDEYPNEDVTEFMARLKKILEGE